MQRKIKMNAEKTDFNEEIQYLSECFICADVFNDSRVLPCIHTFCLHCIQRTGEQKNIRPGEKMSCPICREEFEIPKLGWGNLKKNFFIQRLAEIKKSIARTENKILCDVCHSNGELESNAEIPSASVYCVDCEDNLCEQCHGEHRRNKLSKGHKIAVECRIKHKHYGPQCDEHEMENMTKYCATCKKIICNTCSVEGHSSHSCSDVEKNAAVFGKAIESYIEKADKFVEELMNNRGNLEQEKERSRDEMKVRETEAENTMKELSDNDGIATMEEQNDAGSDAIGRQLAILDNFRIYCNRLISEGLPCEICSSFDEISSRAEVLTGKMRNENSKQFLETLEENSTQNG